MTLHLDNQIPDTINDEIGICLRQLHAIPQWTKEKVKIFLKFETLANRENYMSFFADRRDYHLQRKGQSCLYDVPLDQRGALKRFSGMRIRLVCGGSLNPYSDRIYFAKNVIS